MTVFGFKEATLGFVSACFCFSGMAHSGKELSKRILVDVVWSRGGYVRKNTLTCEKVGDQNVISIVDAGEMFGLNGDERAVQFVAYYNPQNADDDICKQIVYTDKAESTSFQSHREMWETITYDLGTCRIHWFQYETLSLPIAGREPIEFAPSLKSHESISLNTDPLNSKLNRPLSEAECEATAKRLTPK